MFGDDDLAAVEEQSQTREQVQAERRAALKKHMVEEQIPLLFADLNVDEETRAELSERIAEYTIMNVDTAVRVTKSLLAVLQG